MLPLSFLTPAEAYALQPWHPDLLLSLARMELEPVTRTQVAVAAKAQAGEEPTEADMNQQALLEHAHRAEGYLEKVRFPHSLCFLATIIADR